jgi:beta-N-acetylhexosaminidase
MSAPVIQNWLRGELGFRGIILADDFSMGAAASIEPGEAVVRALIAGVDMVMTWPMNIGEIHRAILRALETGRLSRERLLESATRIIAEKIRLGLVPMPEGGEGRGP